MIEALAAAGGSAMGLAGSALGVWGQMQTNAANSKEAQRNRDWQERMSNTAHQREVADLRAAGLNPILSGMGGSGASSGHGAQATMINPFQNASQDYHSAKRFYDVEKKQVSLQEAMQNAQIGREKSQMELNVENMALAREQLKATSAQALKTVQDTDTSRFQAAALAASASRDYALRNLHSAQALNVMADTKLKEVDRYGSPKRLFGGFIDSILDTTASVPQIPHDGTFLNSVAPGNLMQRAREAAGKPSNKPSGRGHGRSF